jgi:ABC-2 type transport system permease protein
LGDLTRITVQMVLVVVIGYIFGFWQDPQISFHYGIAGVVAALLIAMIFAITLMALNVYIALWTRSTEATFIIGNFLTLPLLFTSSAQLPIELLPGWMQAIAHVNPVTYAIDAMRVLLNGPDSVHGKSALAAIAQALAILTVLGSLTLALATSRFRSAVS